MYINIKAHDSNIMGFFCRLYLEWSRKKLQLTIFYKINLSIAFRINSLFTISFAWLI
jgi:hypothetical protein